MDFIEDPREEMANQLLLRGHADMKEILTAAFGEWPPKGLDINPGILPVQEVALKYTERKDAFGYVPESGERILYLNKYLLEGQGVGIHTTMGHEAIHLLQGDHGPRAHEIFGTQAAERSCNTIMSQLLDFDSKQLIRTFNKCSAYDKKYVEASKLNTGSEIQARIHAIIAEGYRDWQAMPQNIDECWMALNVSGLWLPLEISRHLQKLPKSSPVHRFTHGKDYSQGKAEEKCVEEMNMFLGTLSEPGKVMFWRETLPALYADLIEMYGDRQGRARFGLGVNVKNHKTLSKSHPFRPPTH